MGITHREPEDLVGLMWRLEREVQTAWSTLTTLRSDVEALRRDFSQLQDTLRQTQDTAEELRAEMGRLREVVEKRRLS